MGTSRTYLMFITIQLFSLATAQEMDKRIPQGFLGMRGKKYIGADSTEQFYKRRPQFFIGDKGKKSLQEILESGEEFYKRVPMGFIGMRGKKDAAFPELETAEYVPKRDGSLIGEIDYTSNESQNNADSYPILNELLSQYLQKLNIPKTNMNPETELDNDVNSNEVEKRAANLHQFFGVRGKKFFNNDKRPYDVSFRGKFIGVRGKKDLKNSGAHEIKFLLDNPLPKRKSQMGFFGMRGKKWADTDESSLEMEMPN